MIWGVDGHPRALGALCPRGAHLCVATRSCLCAQAQHPVDFLLLTHLQLIPKVSVSVLPRALPPGKVGRPLGHKTTAWPRPPTFPSLQPPFVRDLIQVEPELGLGEGSLRSAGGDAGAWHALTLSPSRPGDAGLARHPPARDGAFHAPGLAHPERERRKKKEEKKREPPPREI